MEIFDWKIQFNIIYFQNSFLNGFAKYLIDLRAKKVIIDTKHGSSRVKTKFDLIWPRVRSVKIGRQTLGVLGVDWY